MAAVITVQVELSSCVALQSGIHGWGLFARKKLKQDSMVIEYRGDLLRRTAADAREKAYQAAGKDCYLFTVNEDCVIDATMTGGIGRFTVCSSNTDCTDIQLTWLGFADNDQLHPQMQGKNLINQKPLQLSAGVLRVFSQDASLRQRCH